MGSSVDSNLVPATETQLRFGTAFGSGPDLGQVIAVDRFGTPSWLNLQHRTTAASTLDLTRWLASDHRQLEFSKQVTSRFALGLDLAEGARTASSQQYDENAVANRFALTAMFDRSRFSVLRGWGLEGQFGLTSENEQSIYSLLGASAFTPPYLGLTNRADGVALAQDLRNGVSLRLAFASDHLAGSSGREGSGSLVMGEVIGRSANGSWIGLQFGGAFEEDRMLRTQGTGALGLPPTSTTRFAGLAGSVYFDRLELFGQVGLGVTEPSGAVGSLLQDVSAIRSSTFGIGLARPGLFITNDTLTMAVSQPLRVDAGTAVIDRPVGLTGDGQIIRRPEHVDLEPEGREVDIEFSYRFPFSNRSSIGFNWLSQLQPSHDRAAPPVHTLAVRLSTEF